jgi:hypothetical protein
MTLMKSLLLGSAATLVAVASAQAADLPTKKGAPAAEYVKVCKIGGIAGFILPGSDTCLKIGGLVTVQVAAGNLGDNFEPGVTGFGTHPAGTVTGYMAPAANGASNYADGYGFFARGEVDLDAVSNTAYGPLHSRIGIQTNYGEGYQTGTGIQQGISASSNLNEAWIQWAGLTVGKHASFFDFLGGGPAWDSGIGSNTGSSTPHLMFAYTATFGGGFSATIAADQPANGSTQLAGGGTTGSPGSSTTVLLGGRAPDIVGSLDVVQGWGKAHLAGVAHNVRLEGLGGSTPVDTNFWGYGVIGGIQFNLPSLGANDNIAVEAGWTHGAIGYGGLAGPNGGPGVNNNNFGPQFVLSDAYFNEVTGLWAVPNEWHVAANATYYFSPQFEIRPELGYDETDYGSNTPWNLSSKVDEWIGGAVFDWIPVTNLDFSLDLLYEQVHQSSPIIAATTGGTPANPVFRNDFGAFEGRLRIERDF